MAAKRCDICGTKSVLDWRGRCPLCKCVRLARCPGCGDELEARDGVKAPDKSKRYYCYTCAYDLNLVSPPEYALCPEIILSTYHTPT